MAARVIWYGAAGQDDNAACTVTLPAFLAENDLVVSIGCDGTLSADKTMALTSSGHTKRQDLRANDTFDCQLGFWEKKQSSSPDASVVLPASGTSQVSTALAVMVIRGQHLTTPFNVADATAQVTDTGVTDPPSNTPTGEACISLLGLGSSVGGDANIVMPANYPNFACWEEGAGSTSGQAAGLAARVLYPISGAVNPGAISSLAGSGGSEAYCAVHAFVEPADISGDDFFILGVYPGIASVALPAHQSGDLFVGFFYRDGSNTLPGDPGNGWTDFQSTAGDSNSFRTMYLAVDSSSETSPVASTSATSMLIFHLRPKQDGTSISIGASAKANGTGTTITHPALSGMNGNGLSRVLAWSAHRSVDGVIETPSSGMEPIGFVRDAADQVGAFWTVTGVGSWSDQTASIGGTSNGWRGVTVEIVVTPPAESTLTIPQAYHHYRTMAA